MNVELKKVKFHEDMSDETNCFSAEIWVDGKVLAYVKNDGQGGGNDYWPVNGQANNSALDSFREWCKAQPHEFEFEYEDQVVDKLFTEWIKKDDTRRQQAQMKRWCKTQTVWRCKGDKPGVWHSRKVPYTPLVGKVLRDRLGGTLETIANEEVTA